MGRSREAVEIWGGSREAVQGQRLARDARIAALTQQPPPPPPPQQQQQPTSCCSSRRSSSRSSRRSTSSRGQRRRRQQEQQQRDRRTRRLGRRQRRRRRCVALVAPATGRRPRVNTVGRAAAALVLLLGTEFSSVFVCAWRNVIADPTRTAVTSPPVVPLGSASAIGPDARQRRQEHSELRGSCVSSRRRSRSAPPLREGWPPGLRSTRRRRSGERRAVPIHTEVVVLFLALAVPTARSRPAGSATCASAPVLVRARTEPAAAAERAGAEPRVGRAAGSVAPVSASPEASAHSSTRPSCTRGTACAGSACTATPPTTR